MRDVTAKFHKLPPAMRSTYREAYQRQMSLAKLFDDAGIRMMVGTDGGGQAPGQSIHQEFDELAKADLCPLKTLQMMTLNPAEFLGRTGTMGSIEVGRTPKSFYSMATRSKAFRTCITFLVLCAPASTTLKRTLTI